jgi:ankyrin repeat protein
MPLSSEPPLHRAASRGDLKLVERLLREGTPVDLLDSVGHTALMAACITSQHLACEMLLAAGANPHHESLLDSEAWTPLLLSASVDSPLCAGALLAHGADPNRPNGRGELPWELWAQAADRHGPALGRLLASHGAVLARSRFASKDPVALASIRGHDSALEVFFEQGVDPRAPLFCAAFAPKIWEHAESHFRHATAAWVRERARVLDEADALEQAAGPAPAAKPRAL